MTYNVLQVGFSVYMLAMELFEYAFDKITFEDFEALNWINFIAHMIASGINLVFPIMKWVVFFWDPWNYWEF